MKYFLWILIAGSMLALASCKDDDLPLDPTPKLTLVEATPTTVTQFTDSVIIRFRYEDGDGDLGFSEPDSFALRVWDSRLTQPDLYFVPPLAPLNEEISIQGVLRIAVPNLFLLGSGSSETTTFTIRIKDRAGNWSNEITTPVITINE